MLKTLLATTALAATLTYGAQAQEAAAPAADPLVPPAADAPADMSAEPAPETAQDPGAMAPEQPATETAQDPGAMTPEEPAAETAEDPGAMTPDEPAVETAEEPDAMTPDEPAMDTAEEPGSMMPEQPETETVQDQAPETTPVAPGEPMLGDAGPVLTPVASADISADALIGANIQTPDGETIAEVDDVLLTPDGAVENIAARFGGFLGFGADTVLLTMDEIEVLQDESGTFVVQTSLTPEALEGRPTVETEN